MSTANRIDTHQHLIPAHYAAWMKEKGIRPGGVLSLSTPGVYFGDASEARRWAREINGVLLGGAYGAGE